MSATTSNKQKLRGRRKSKMSGKTYQNDCCETKEEVIQGASVTCDDTVNKSDPEKEVQVQDERSDVACSQKIIPTFKKLKRTRQMERKVYPDQSSIPHKRLKSASGSNKKSTKIVTTVQVHNEDKWGKVQPYTDPSNAGQLATDQSDQSSIRTEQQTGNAGSVVKPKLQKISVTQGQNGKVEPPMLDFLKLKNNNSDKMSGYDNRSQSKDKDKDIEDDELVYSGCLGAENPREPGGKMESKEVLIEEHVSNGDAIGELKKVPSEDNFSDEQKRNSPECLYLSERTAENHSIIPNKEKYRNENTNKYGKDHQTTYDNQNSMHILNNSLSDSVVPKIGQISKTAASSIPPLKVISAIVVEQYKRKLVELPQEETDQVKQDSSAVKEDSIQHQRGLVSEPRRQEDSKTKDIGEMASGDLRPHNIPVTVNNKKCIDAGKDASTCIGNLTSDGEREAAVSNLTSDREREAGVSNLTSDGEREAAVSNLTSDGEREAAVSNLTSDGEREAGVSNLTSDGGREAAVSNRSLEQKAERGSEADTFSRPSSAGVEGEEISDSQLCAITTMDWTEEPLGPSGDTAGSHGATSPALPTAIPDGTSIVKGLIREVSQLNMMLLRAKREMQTANQRKPPTNDNKTNMWTKK